MVFLSLLPSLLDFHKIHHNSQGRKANRDLEPGIKYMQTTTPKHKQLAGCGMDRGQGKGNTVSVHVAFKTKKSTVVLEKTLWTARRSNQSILKEIRPEYSLERLMLKLKCRYFGHLM